ncbi:MAG: cobalamin B12-binding domain-containing protein [Rhodoplanes sp.]|uniref:cobalamin B12-binding domain-containing protein n=1 Tax=Rhodoplanes sp. TaxID=1968906 RepID=UPI0018129749|nr:cobalamin-dependent protein [Rhodoplanes sp.]NVO16868.1 cobalamin B12-binding domain-containing protein [Rhodoplanes sp.]
MAEARPQLAARDLWDNTNAYVSGDGSAADPHHAGEQYRSADLSRFDPHRMGEAHRTASGTSPVNRAVEFHIVPKLVLAHTGRCDAGPQAHPLGSEEVAELTDRVLAGDDAGALAFVEAVLARGMPVERIYLDVLAPTARRLGQMWHDDACDFTQVTLGLWRLHRVLREFSAAFGSEVEHQQDGLPVLLVPVPGEQHTFGLAMVAEFFRRAGWLVWDAPVPARDDLVTMVRSEWFAVVGFSLSCESRLEALASCIQLVRRESCNRSVGILVGGRVFAEHPDYVARVGADVAASDARQAPIQAQSLVAALAHRI